MRKFLLIVVLLAATRCYGQVVLIENLGSCLQGQVPVLQTDGSMHFDCFSVGFGRVYYPKNSANSDLAGDTAVTATYKQANTTPSAGAESDLVISSPTTSAYVFGQGYATASTQPDVTTLPAGTAYRYIFAKVDNGSASIKTDLLRYNTSANEATTGAQITISFALNGAAADAIHRSAGDFTADGFTAGVLVTASGTTGGLNDKSFTVQSVTASDLTLILADAVTAEAEGASITVVTKEKLLRSGTSATFTDTALKLQVVTYADASSYTFATNDRIIFKWWAAKQSGGGTRTITISTESVAAQSYIQTTLR